MPVFRERDPNVLLVHADDIDVVDRSVIKVKKAFIKIDEKTKILM